MGANMKHVMAVHSFIHASRDNGCWFIEGKLEISRTLLVCIYTSPLLPSICLSIPKSLLPVIAKHNIVPIDRATWTTNLEIWHSY